MTPSRVASSLLHSLNVSELVTRDVREYVDLAIRLGSNRMLLKAYQERIRVAARSQFSFFDTSRQAVLTTRGYEGIREVASWRRERASTTRNCDKAFGKLMNIVIL